MPLASLVTVPPDPKETASALPLIIPWLVTVPAPPVRNPPRIIPAFLKAPAPIRLMAHPPADETVPLLTMVQAVPAAPSIPSLFAPVDVIVPVLVMVSGSSEGPRVKGPVIALFIFRDMVRFL